MMCSNKYQPNLPDPDRKITPLRLHPRQTDLANHFDP